MTKEFRKTWMLPVLSLLIIMLVIAVIAGIQQDTVKYSADYPAYETLKAAVAETDAIVFGKIIETKNKEINAGVVSEYNVFRVKISEASPEKPKLAESSR